MQSNPFDRPVEPLRDMLVRLLKDGDQNASPGKVQSHSFTAPGALPPAPLPQQQQDFSLQPTPQIKPPYTWTQGLADMMSAYNKGQANNRDRSAVAATPFNPVPGNEIDWGV